ncbi:type II toxin-antitoxin system PemK/MazF family toxin [Mesorhizobium sp. WSM1293]|uniref:type II toxin-antitoxin system PemK/MazF family toxin n=1 Tax=Mesorhizobium sp. WSM1293 TaxID=1040984 RepID=UPI00047F0F73|nr:type II toxin-antitoxin system PemK/MazF family toxin [Mesorhizobium sp. WSM1293]
MPLPDPQLGLVISYAYLWHHEHQAGQDEGRKDRPCVIVLAVERGADGLIVTVVPVTHVPPADPSLAIELPPAVKRHLELDGERSWVMLHEGNRFAWPGYDLRPVPRSTDRYDYGLLPPRLFSSLVERLRTIWEAGQGRQVPRD